MSGIQNAGKKVGNWGKGKLSNTFNMAVASPFKGLLFGLGLAMMVFGGIRVGKYASSESKQYDYGHSGWTHFKEVHSFPTSVYEDQKMKDAQADMKSTRWGVAMLVIGAIMARRNYKGMKRDKLKRDIKRANELTLPPQN